MGLIIYRVLYQDSTKKWSHHKTKSFWCIHIFCYLHFFHRINMPYKLLRLIRKKIGEIWKWNIWKNSHRSLMQPLNAKAVTGNIFPLSYKLIIDRYVLFPQLQYFSSKLIPIFCRGVFCCTCLHIYSKSTALQEIFHLHSRVCTETVIFLGGGGGWLKKKTQSF